MKLSRHTRKAIVRALQNEDDSMQRQFIETLLKMGITADEIHSYMSESKRRPRKERIHPSWRLKRED